MEDELKQIQKKVYYFKGFGFHHLSALTNEDETIKGGSLYLFGKQCMTIAISDGLWTKEDGKPYNFKLKDGVLYIRKISIGFGSR